VYTQCPDCTTVFRVSADTLRSAHGNVRCGVCATSFNALENLSEEQFHAAREGDERQAPEDTITVEELPGNESIELSTAMEADSASVTAAEEGDDAAAPAEEASLEFDGDIADLDRLFVETSAMELRHMAAAVRAADLTPPTDVDPGAIAASLSMGHDADEQLHSDLDPTDEYPIIVLDESDEVSESAAPAEESQPVFESESRADSDEFLPSPFQTPRILIPDELRMGLADEAAANAITATEFGEPDDDDGLRRWPWTLGAAILLLVLGGQVVHAERDQLARQPLIGAFLAQSYAFLGSPISLPTDLATYELRQWGAASDSMHPGRLLLRASIVNRATHPQPYPLLRLALQDRFGTTVGERDIEPADYLPGEGTGRLLGPGQRADAEIRIVDPGKDAVGFELDVCLPLAGRVRCANERQATAP
jgi:predicted Zn finger-like uncharacterized protein